MCDHIPMRTLRVATLNLWNKSGPWSHRKRLIQEEIDRLEPDILGLQELLRLDPSIDTTELLASSELGTRPGSDGPTTAPAYTDPAYTQRKRGEEDFRRFEEEPRAYEDEPEEVTGERVSLVRNAPPSRAASEEAEWTPENDQLTELAQGLRHRHHVVFTPARSYGGGLVMGNGLLSRHPIVESQGFRLPGAESGETRSLLYAVVETPFGLLPVFVTHLNWKWHQGSVRLRQVKYIADRIAELEPPLDREEVASLPASATDRLPPVLLGDFNAEPDSDEIRFLRGLHTLDGTSVYFADAWHWGGDGSPGYTFDRRNDFAARSNEPHRRIDYVFVRGPDEWLRGEPQRTRVAFHEPQSRPDGPVWPSDHFGLVTELSVERRHRP